MKPFSDHHRFEQNSGDDPFFLTGSNGSIGELPRSFSGALAGKEQFRLSFNVTSNRQMLACSSSIYYFNVVNGTWNLPSNSSQDHVGPFDKFAFCTAWQNPSGTFGDMATAGSVFIEDAKGFDAYGRSVCSGSLDIFRQVGWPSLINTTKNQTIEVIGKGFNSAKEIFPYLTTDYKKSVQRSTLYDASANETFELNIKEQFLIEKVVFEIPFSAGQSWFDDLTTTCLAYGKGNYNESSPQEIKNPTFYYDKGGPGLTLSLFCQKNYGTQKIRDLILTGLITHSADAQGDIRARLYDYPITEGGINPLVIVETMGLKNPSSVVTKNASSQFTGSIIVKTSAKISNGASGFVSSFGYAFNQGIIDLLDTQPKPPDLTDEQWNNIKKMFRSMSLQKYLESCRDTFSRKKIISNRLGPGFNFFQGNILNGDEHYFTVSSLDPFGRGMTGFAPSGGSIFGKEYFTPQINTDGTTLIDNPYYIEDPERIDNVVNEISSTFDTVFKTFGYSPPKPPGLETSYVLNISDGNLFSGETESPYLINPGDKLILAISKTRPAISGSKHIVPDSNAADIGYQRMTDWSNLIGDKSGHDVCLITGSINMTIYGSYVKAGSRYSL